LRRYDDSAKVPGLDVPPLEHYHDRILRVLGSHASRSAQA
jgi:hypothetical protein